MQQLDSPLLCNIAMVLELGAKLNIIGSDEDKHSFADPWIQEI